MAKQVAPAQSVGTIAYQAAQAYARMQTEVSPAIQARLASAFMHGAIWLQGWQVAQLQKTAREKKHAKRKN